VFSVTSNTTGIVFYFGSLVEGPDVTFDEIQSSLDLKERTLIHKLYDQTFGYKYFQTGDTVTINKLHPKRKYKAQFYFLNSMQRVSDSVNKTFTTLENGGQLARIDYVFVKPLSEDKKVMISCLLTEYFSISSKRIINYAFDTCNKDDKPHELTFSNTIMVPNVNNTYTYSYYIYPEQTNSFDGSNSVIQQGLNQPEYRDWMINKNVSDFAEVRFSKELNNKAPTFLNEIQLETGIDWVYLKNVELQEHGYVIACLVNSNITNYAGSSGSSTPTSTTPTTTTTTEKPASTTETTTEKPASTTETTEKPTTRFLVD
jgi:hypothetical protein